MTLPRTLVYVHGGVSGSDKPLTSLAHALVQDVAATSALDGAEQAVCRLEDDPELNAGWGSVLNHDGAIELDAGIADGASGRRGRGRGRERSPSDLACAAGDDIHPSRVDGGSGRNGPG